MSETTRLEREKEFHDERFTEETRVKSQKFYSIVKESKQFYSEQIFENLKNKKVLEIGCATGAFSQKILTHDVEELIGIDISEVAIQKSRELNIARSGNSKFLVMDGAELKFTENYFDKIIGQSVLHHLDFEKAIKNISSVLSESGKGIFLEPLGMNPLINLYRKLTPNERTEDEKPLENEELEIFNKYFNEVKITHFYFFTLFAVLFRNMFFFEKLKLFLMGIDNYLFKFSFFQKFAWTVVIELSKPVRFPK